MMFFSSQLLLLSAASQTTEVVAAAAAAAAGANLPLALVNGDCLRHNFIRESEAAKLRPDSVLKNPKELFSAEVSNSHAGCF